MPKDVHTKKAFSVMLSSSSSSSKKTDYNFKIAKEDLFLIRKGLLKSVTMKVTIKRGKDPLLLLELNIGEIIEDLFPLLSIPTLCKIVSVEFSYSGRSATVQCQLIQSL